MSEDKKRSVDTETQSDESQKLPIVKPLWDGWNQPIKPSEALKIGEEYAKMEGLWCAGLLLGLRNEVDDDADEQLRLELLAKGIGCGDVKACATGILVMSVLDGPAVTAFFSPGFSNVENELVRHKVGGPATVFLAAGLSKAAAEVSGISTDSDIDSYEKILDTYMAGPKPGPNGGRSRMLTEEAFRVRQARSRKQDVIEINDAHDRETDAMLAVSAGEKHHAVIVKGFQYGREFAEQHEGELGFSDAAS